MGVPALLPVPVLQRRWKHGSMSGKQVGRGSEERCKMPWGREVTGMPVGGRPKAPHLEDRAQVGPEGKKKGTSQPLGQKPSRLRANRTGKHLALDHPRIIQ